MNQYELVTIINPLLSDADAKKLAKKYATYIKDHQGTFVHEEHWGLKDLAYPINNKTTGIYHLMEFQFPGEEVARLETEFKRDENIVRWMITRLDKDAIAYNERRRARLSAEKKAAKEAETSQA